MNRTDQSMEDEHQFQFLLEKIKRNRNIDFGLYRRSVLRRRIEERLHAGRCRNLWEYIMLLNRDPGEYDRLISTLTIKFSEFFRDPDAFDLLDQVIIPEIIDSRQGNGRKVIRSWSCGTAFGQEAYSLAILFCEVLGSRLGNYDLNILATDIDRSALETAPWRSYDLASLKKIKPHIVFKYFTLFDDRCTLNDKIRSLVTFRYHNIVSENHNSDMDLVLCKNVLIYFEKELQERVLRSLHEALNPGGFLVLGKTETIIPQLADAFEIIDVPGRIYRKN